MKKTDIMAVVGPTASGKTELAAMIAEKHNGEVVSCDSMQIYNFAPIATAMPTKEEMRGVPHHMLGFLSPGESFSVSKYTEMASQILTEISERGKLPVLVGGTGLYYSSLVDNIRFLPEGYDEEVRKKLLSRAEREGSGKLYEELSAIDPQTAAAVNQNDTKRILRGLEVYYSTGKTLSQQRESSRLVPSPYNPCIIGLDFRDRQRLYDRINRRVDRMFENGLLAEAREVLESSVSGTGMQAIGIKELKSYFEGETSLEEAAEKIKQETRRYAKRQLTWFRRDKRIHWIYIDEICRANILPSVEKIMETFFNL